MISDIKSCNALNEKSKFTIDELDYFNKFPSKLSLINFYDKSDFYRLNKISNEVFDTILLDIL